MGCWNATCGLTGLPIHHGDPVIAMFIQDKAFGRIEGSRRELTPSYVYQSFEPASFLVRGEYDDYGSVDLEEREKLKIMLTAEDARRYGKDVLIEREGEEPRYGFAMATLDRGFNIEDGHRQDDLPFALWMAHAPIFDKLVDGITEQFYERTNDEKGYRYVTRTIKETTQKSLADALAKHQKGSERLFSFDSPWRESSTLTGAPFRYVEDMMAQAGPQRRVQDGKLIEVDGEPLDENVMALLTGSWADLVALYHVMASLRITLWPTGACGSQDGDLDPHKVRWAAMNDYIVERQKQEREWDAECEEDEDDDGAEPTT